MYDLGSIQQECHGLVDLNKCQTQNVEIRMDFYALSTKMNFYL